ncbi:hypothetical protein GQ600_26332 [Phytophthora cactorum]|nr:hypothetical protein GQ600_26332 [Phytophthora cactorum]
MKTLYGELLATNNSSDNRPTQPLNDREIVYYFRRFHRDVGARDGGAVSWSLHLALYWNAVQDATLHIKDFVLVQGKQALLNPKLYGAQQRVSMLQQRSAHLKFVCFDRRVPWQATISSALLMQSTTAVQVLPRRQVTRSLA